MCRNVPEYYRIYMEEMRGSVILMDLLWKVSLTLNDGMTFLLYFFSAEEPDKGQVSTMKTEK